MIRRIMLVVGVPLVIGGILVFTAALDHDLGRHEAKPLEFEVAGATIMGTVWTPASYPTAVVALVHGDGPQDRTSSGGYAPLINYLLDEGFAVASWDKPGIGRSAGNWLDQSMEDRALETRAALSALAKGFHDLPVGALGFSQAGWVLPRLTDEDADFLVLVGAATSWRDQGKYFTRRRLESKGMDTAAIDRVVADIVAADDEIFASDAQVEAVPDEMTPDRWKFIRRNSVADARHDLARLDLPLLAIWGADDLNVDAHSNAATYRKIIATPQPDVSVVVWPDATHGLLRSPAYSWQLTSQWSAVAKARFFFEGRNAYAPGA